MALEAKSAAVMNNRITGNESMVCFSRRTLWVNRQNVTMALGSKAVFPVTTVIGMTGLWIAILADTGATVLAIANAPRLLNARIW